VPYKGIGVQCLRLKPAKSIDQRFPMYPIAPTWPEDAASLGVYLDRGCHHAIWRACI